MLVPWSKAGENPLPLFRHLGSAGPMGNSLCEHRDSWHRLQPLDQAMAGDYCTDGEHRARVDTVQYCGVMTRKDIEEDYLQGRFEPGPARSGQAWVWAAAFATPVPSK